MVAEFVIVQFVDMTPTEVEVVPSRWLRGQEHCAWPPFKSIVRVESAIKSQILPAETWEKYRIRILFEDNSHAVVRRKLANAEVQRLKAKHESARGRTPFSCDNHGHSTSSEQTSLPSQESIPLETISPLPKAAPRKTKGGRKKGATLILTSTPVKTALEEQSKPKQQPKDITGKGKAKRKLNSSGINDQDISKQGRLDPDSEDSHTDDVPFLPPLTFDNTATLKKDEFALVQFKTERNREVFYIGQVQAIEIVEDELEFEMTFLRRLSSKSSAFKFPIIADISDVELKDVVAKLPNPVDKGGRLLSFAVDLTPYSNKLC